MLWGNLGSKNKKPQAALQLFNNSWESQSVLVTLPMNWEDSLLHLWGGMAQLLYSSQKCYQKIRKWMRKHSFPTESFMMQQELMWFPRLTKTITCQKKPKNNQTCIYCAIRIPNYKQPNQQQSYSALQATLHISLNQCESPVTQALIPTVPPPVVMAAFFHPRNGLVWPYLA